MSEIIDGTDAQTREEALQRTAQALDAGELAVLPTDTVYGVGADAFSAQAVALLLAAKGRNRTMPPPVLIASKQTLEGLARDVPQAARDLIDHFWPGALTIIVHAQPSLQWDLGETHGTVALRVPDDELTVDLLGRTGPLAVSSANRTGSPAPRTIAEAQAQLAESISIYLDGGDRTGNGLPSTIVDATSEPLRIVRSGAISESELRAVVPDVIGSEITPDAQA